ncbi:MarR family transcriptional regulator [Caldithrix abyssi]
MQELKDYLHTVLGISIQLKPISLDEQTDLPLFIRQMYALYQAELFGRQTILLERRNVEPITAYQLRKHSEMLEKTFNCPVVFVLPNIESYNRKRLIQKQVAFVIPGKQLFIPQLLIDLRDFRQSAQQQWEKLLPAAQCLFLYHLLKEPIETNNLKEIAEKLHYTKMTVTRAAKNLQEKGIATIEGKKEKRIIFGGEKKELWKKALPFLQSPVKKVYFLEHPPQEDFVYRASFSALSHYTNLADTDKAYFAVSQKDFETLKKKQIQIVHSNEADVHLEVWKYAPGVLAKGRVVDPLSLYLSLKNQQDERVQKALDTLLEKVW